MTGKRFYHDGVVIIDHLKKDLIYIDGKDELLELAEYVDRLQEENTTLMEENEQLKQENQSWLKTASHLDTIAHEDRDYAKRMHKENEQLKSENKKLNERIGILEGSLIDKGFDIND